MFWKNVWYGETNKKLAGYFIVENLEGERHEKYVGIRL